MGLLARARTIQDKTHEVPDPPPKVLGLLGRARGALVKDISLIPTMLSEIGRVRDGVDAPHRSFEILKTIIPNFEAVFFLLDYDKKNLLPAWAFPQTVLGDAPLPLTGQLIEHTDTVTLLGSNEEIQKKLAFLPHLASANKLLLVSCSENETAMDGLLIISKGTFLEFDDNSIMHIGLTLSKAIGGVIKESRAVLMQGISSKSILGYDQFIQHIETNFDNEDSLIIKISKDQAYQIFVRAVPNALKQSFEQDCMDILGCVVHGNGYVSCDKNSYYLYMSGINYLNRNMVCEQLNFSFQQAFSSDFSTLIFDAVNKDTVLGGVSQAS